MGTGMGTTVLLYADGQAYARVYCVVHALRWLGRRHAAARLCCTHEGNQGQVDNERLYDQIKAGKAELIDLLCAMLDR